MSEIPLFPLHAVLCPGIAMPLRVFEPRYRAMVRHCLRHERLFCVVRIRDGREVGMARPELESVGTIAEIRELERHDGGGLDLVVVGGPRVRLGPARQEPEGYLTAETEPIAEAVGDQERARALAARVGQLFVRYLELLRPAESTSEVEVEVEIELEGEGDVEPEAAGEAGSGGWSTPAERLRDVPAESAPLEPGDIVSGPDREPAARDPRLDEVARRLTVPEDPTALSHLLSGIVQIEPTRRQVLLEAPTAEARLARLEELLNAEIFLLERQLAALLVDPREAVARAN